MKKLQILGTGCPTCAKLAEMVDEVARGLEIDYELEKVTDIDQITAFGVMSTPALAVNGEIKFSGGLRTAEELKEMIR
jgi:small redox-active disulfide protein 2